MQAYAETASKAVAKAESALYKVLGQPEPDHANFEPSLEKFRRASHDYIFLTFATTVAKEAEDRLWEGHVRVNKKFQKHLKQFRDGAGRKKHVERRKAENHYLYFIKSSSNFYRGYIQSLASHFANVPEIKTIAAKLHLTTLSVSTPVNVTVEQQIILYTSCHNSLMRLGDLSRYREAELEQTVRNWGPAKGHYQLALSLKPGSGAAYNQLAVMALADDDHLRAVYHLHRAAAASRPFPVAGDNIKLEFEKLLKVETEDRSAISDTSKQTIEVLESRFLHFHAKCHRHPCEFLKFGDDATGILQLMTLSFEESQDRSLDKIMQKVCLINISAEHLAWQGTTFEMQPPSGLTPTATEAELKMRKTYSKNFERAKDEFVRNCQAVFLLQRFNILTFTALLKILARELASASELAEAAPNGESKQVPLPVRRLLPHLRQYSTWLLSNIHSILNPRHASTQSSCLDQFWKSYVKTLNFLLSSYSIGEIADLDHLLEEDEDTLAFAPFSEKVGKWRYNFDEGGCKPAFASDTERPYEEEMLTRIRRFVFDAATISSQKDALEIEWSPISFDGSQFHVEAKPAQAPVIVQPSIPLQPFRIRAHAHTSSLNDVSPARSPRPEPGLKAPASPRRAPTPLALSQNPPIVQAVSMENMVNDLVNGDVAPFPSREPENATSLQLPEMHSSSMLLGTEKASSNPLNIMDIVRGMQQRSNGLSSAQILPAAVSQTVGNPSLPGIWSTAFTPRPGESSMSASRPGTASSRSPMHRPQRSSAQFYYDFQQQERDILLRTSPQPTADYSSWNTQHEASPQTKQAWTATVRSPWHSPAQKFASPQHHNLPQAALFGAIGEPRTSSSHGPSSSGHSG